MRVFRILQNLDEYLVSKFGVIRARRLGRFLVGFIPTVGAISFVIHCVVLLCGGESHVAAFLFKYALLWFFMLTVLSVAFEFCWVHRGFLCYNYVVGYLIEHQMMYGLGDWLIPLRWAALFIGLFLLFAFVRNNCWRDFFEHTKHYK